MQVTLPHNFLREDCVHGFFVHKRIFEHHGSQIHFVGNFGQNVFRRFLDYFFGALSRRGCRFRLHTVFTSPISLLQESSSNIIRPSSSSPLSPTIIVIITIHQSLFSSRILVIIINHHHQPSLSSSSIVIFIIDHYFHHSSSIIVVHHHYHLHQ